jgi:hypothetical protein
MSNLSYMRDIPVLMWIGLDWNMSNITYDRTNRRSINQCRGSLYGGVTYSKETLFMKNTLRLRFTSSSPLFLMS